MPARASPHRHSAAFARERDARVLALLEAHPSTALMLVRLGWFPSRYKALKRLRRLVARRLVRVVGTVCRGVGRPEHVFCRYRPRSNSLLHEVQMTEVFLRLHAGRILRGPQVEDRQLLADAEVWINGRLYFLELDRGSMGPRQMERRFALYRPRAELSLWICPSVSRRDNLRRRASGLRQTALFATLAEVLAAPHGSIWLDVGGVRAALPRHREGEGGQQRGQ